MLINNWEYHPIGATGHSGGANMGMADGHVERLLPDDLPPATGWISVGAGYALSAPAYHYYIDLRSPVNSPKQSGSCA